MARVKSGILGMVTGKIGSLVIYPMYGNVYARTAPTINPHRIKSAAQLAQLNKLKLIAGFLTLCTDFIKIGYKAGSLIQRKTTYNLSQSYHLKNAVKGEFPSQEIDWEKIRLSSGNLAEPENLRLSMQEDRMVLNWDNPAKMSYQERDQQTMVLVYCAETRKVYMELYKAQKKDGSQVLALPVDPELKYTYHVYFNFKSLLTDEVSTSVYAGISPGNNVDIEMDPITGTNVALAVQDVI